MPSSRAVVATPNARRYLRMLCKHWSHKFEVVYDETHGRVPFSDEASADFAIDDAERLVLRATHADAAQLPRLQGVIAEHLQRFAIKEPLAFNWSADAPDDAAA